MSPEQLQGANLDSKTDIWSLGVILYELISGKRPFTGDYDQATAYAIVHEPHVPLQERRPGIPVSLAELVDRCLEKSAERRYRNAEEVGDELSAIAFELQTATSLSPHSIAILPFSDLSAEKENAYLSEGLTEEIITSLSRLPMIRVISRATVMSFQRAQKSMKQIASELGVKYLLEGSVRKNGHHLRIAAQLIDAGQDAYLWADKYDGTAKEVFEIQDRVAASVVKALKMRLTATEKKKLTKRQTANAEAYQLYLKGRYFWNIRNKESLHLAIRYFQDAIKKDPKYARAWAGLADAYNLLSEYGGISRKESFPKAMDAAKKAIRYDDQLAEAHTSLACLLMLYEWDWAQSEKEFKRAIRLDPTYATAHHWYSEWLLFHGRMDDAIREISLAVELDPLSPALLKDMGIMMYYAEKYDAAIECGVKTLELLPEFGSAYRLLSLAYAGQGKIEEAIAANEKWEEHGGTPPEAKIGLGWLLALAGKREEAIRIAEETADKHADDGVLLRGVALVYSALGDTERTFAWLTKAYEKKSESLTSIPVDPKFKHLRTHPAFAQLVKRLGLSS